MVSSRSEQVFDVVVVGAGPAGLAAATSAARGGARTALVDAGAEPGGQYWRHPVRADGADAVTPDEVSYLHHDLTTFRRLRRALAEVEASGACFSQHHVWTIVRRRDEFVVHAVDRSGPQERAREIRGRRLVLAPGAYDRQIPFPGWDLPGVMTAGGAQALLKGHRVVAGKQVLVAGTGPFLLSVAAGLAESGASVLGVHEASAPTAWLGHAGAVLRNITKLGEAAAYSRTLARHRVPVRTRSVVVAAQGTDSLEQVTVGRIARDGSVLPGSEQTIPVDVLAVGWGFTPQLELPLTLGCETKADVDGSLVCVVDDDQRSSVEDVYVAGEACGVGGAALAVIEGTIAGAAAAGRSGDIDKKMLRRRAALSRFAAAMHAAHPVPAGWAQRLSDETLVCRCEEVTVGALREVTDDLQAADARSAKLLARAGMGWCQGRVCGYATSCLLAEWTGRAVGTALPNRPVAAPLTLGVLASSGDSGE